VSNYDYFKIHHVTTREEAKEYLQFEEMELFSKPTIIDPTMAIQADKSKPNTREFIWKKSSVEKNPIMAQREIMDVKLTSVKEALQFYLHANDADNDRYVNHYYRYTAQQCLDPPLNDFYHKNPENLKPTKLTNQDIESSFQLIQLENQKSSSLITAI